MKLIILIITFSFFIFIYGCSKNINNISTKSTFHSEGYYFNPEKNLLGNWIYLHQEKGSSGLVDTMVITKNEIFINGKSHDYEITLVDQVLYEIHIIVKNPENFIKLNYPESIKYLELTFPDSSTMNLTYYNMNFASNRVGKCIRIK